MLRRLEPKQTLKLGYFFCSFSFARGVARRSAQTSMVVTEANQCCALVKSLNISVACAVSIYEAFRQRREKGMYSEHRPLNQTDAELLFNEYERRHEEKMEQKRNKKPPTA